MRVLFTTQPGHGHLQPMAPYAQALAAAGDEVRVATAAGFCPAVEALGLEAVPIGVDFTWERPTQRFPELAAATDREAMREPVRAIVWDHWIPAATRDLAALIDSWGPDLIVREAAEFAAVFAAREPGVPVAVAVWGALPTDPLWDLAVVPNSVVYGEFARRLPGVDPEAQLESELMLSSLPPSWIPPEMAGRVDVHHFRMPPLDGAGIDDEWEAPAGGRPLIYATLGTVFGWDRELRSLLIEALGGLDADALMTVGRAADPDRITAPPNVRVERYVPQSLVLRHAAAVVSHGGLGTMIGAIAAGLPMVLIDLGADHPLNGARAEQLGVGESLPRAELEAATVRDAVERALTDAERRARGRALAEEYARLPPPAAAVELLHAYAVS